MATIYKITERGDVAYYRALDAAERDLRACGGDFAETTLTVRGALIYDGRDTVGEVIADADVPARDRWQIA
jgi:hypothetical protein